MNPPENAFVLFVDEKTQIQALDRTQPMLPMRPGQIARRTHEYKRNGMANLYAAFNILTGQVSGRTKRHGAREFIDFLRQINRAVPADLALHVILDNSSTHKTAAVMEWLKARPRFRFHFTPTSASWLNAVETWFGQLKRRSIHRGVFTSVKDLRDEIHRFIRQHNKKSAKPFAWTKSATVILEKVSKLKGVTNQTGQKRIDCFMTCLFGCDPVLLDAFDPQNNPCLQGVAPLLSAVSHYGYSACHYVLVGEFFNRMTAPT